MAITFACEDCGKSYTVGDNLAGKSGTCKQCGHKMRVPSATGAGPDRDGIPAAIAWLDQQRGTAGR
jgi:DNA-directed RNA polymerase subunit RPC12/RpoP